MRPVRILIIRFSSFGDIVQALSVPKALKKLFPEASITWLIRKDLASLVEYHPEIDEVLTIDRKDGVWRFLKSVWTLSQTPYTHVYDAHVSLRSRVFLGFFRLRSLFSSVKILKRPKHRIRRYLFLKRNLPLLPQPFRGIHSYLSPLQAWGYSESHFPPTPSFFPGEDAQNQVKSLLSDFEPYLALAPSAAWKMKRWPVSHWKTLLQSLNENVVLLGGPEDTFCEELAQIAPFRIRNLSGKLSLLESGAVLERAKAVIANDTGLLHVADQLGVPCLALIGPTAFGYPSHPRSHTLELDLPCKPCSKDGRGTCKNAIYQRCLVDLTPDRVQEALTQLKH